MGETYNKAEDEATCRSARKKIAEILACEGSVGKWQFLNKLLQFMDRKGFLSFRQVHVLGQIYDETVPVPESRRDEGLSKEQWLRAQRAKNRRDNYGKVTARPDGKRLIDRLLC